MIRVKSLVQVQHGPEYFYDVGGIAQLVERCFCMADVSGSNPLISTNRETKFKLKIFIVKKVKRIRAYDGYLGVQKR